MIPRFPENVPYYNKDEFIRHLHKLQPTMTICIAAICEDWDGAFPRIVFCADRLVTALIQYESGQTKITRLTPYCFALSSTNNSQVSDMILENVREKLENETKHLKIKEITEMVKAELINVKNTSIEEDVLAKYNLTAKKVNIDPAEFADRAMNEVSRYRYPLVFECVILGFDSPTEAHLYTIEQDGKYYLWDSPGFAYAGSGGFLAFLQIAKSRHTKQDPVSRTISLVYFAKKVSEMAEGVGKKTTDLFVLYPHWDDPNKMGDPDTALYLLYNPNRQALLSTLDKAFEDIQKFEEQKIEEISHLIDEALTPKEEAKSDDEQAEKKDDEEK